MKLTLDPARVLTLDPARVLALVLIVSGVVAWARAGDAPDAVVAGCAEGQAACEPTPTPGGTPPAPVSTFAAEEFCTDVGYLCAGLEEEATVQLRRWRGHEGTLVVHVPQPEGLESGDARALQRAAAQGVRAWNNQPFPILVDLRGDRDPHFALRWGRYRSGTRLGLTRTSWSPATGLLVDFIELGMYDLRGRGQAADPRQVRLTAAHEMGHALGMPHSGSPGDVMYPTNTATSMSAQDYRTVEVLYGLPDGTSITR